MNDSVKVCVDARVNFFGQYYDIPESIKDDVDRFIQSVNELGEASADSAEFEERFVASGLSETFNGLITKCTPKAYQMTAQDKQVAKDTLKQLLHDDRGDIIKGAASELVDTAAHYAGEEMVDRRRKQMIEDGAYRDYTVASNCIDDARTILKGLKGLFKK